MASSRLTPDEEKLVDTFTEKVSTYREHEHLPPISRNVSVKFLMARKFDYQRAVELYLAHQEMRRTGDLLEIDIRDAALQRELNIGKFTLLAGRDSTGAALALFTARLHLPLQSTHQAVLKSLIYMLDAALESYETQRHGLVFIYDMSDSKYVNFDYDLSIKILSLLKGAYPARLKKVLIVTAPLWFKAPFKILRLFVREKLRDRVYTVSLGQLPQHIPRDSLPQKMGGHLTVNHKAWLQMCAAVATHTNADIDTFFVSRSKQLNSRSSSDNSEFVVIHTAESDDSKETIAEKQSNEEGEKSGMVLENGLEKEVNVEKHDNRNNPKRRRESDSRNRHSKELSDANNRAGESGSNGASPPQPCKKRPLSGGSNIFEDSIHMAEDGGMTVHDLVKYVKTTKKKGLYELYAAVRKEPPAGTFNHTRAKYNQPKNRYSDVLCLDQSRVILPPMGDDPSADYINANFVDGYMQKHAYISTQGPLPRTFSDFWHMVWQCQCVIVVMTTRATERGRVKCGQYWPQGEEGEEEYGEFLVANTGMETTRDYTITGLLLHNTQTGESRPVTHLQFTTWPDYGIPQTAAGFLDFLLRVRACQADAVSLMEPQWQGHPNGPPIVVHCSAGIGRTGTFITTDISLRRLDHIHTVDVDQTVRRIRSQRSFSIQMPDQYVFCHLAVIEYAAKRGLISDEEWTSLEEHDSETE